MIRFGILIPSLCLRVTCWPKVFTIVPIKLITEYPSSGYINLDNLKNFD